MLSKLPAWAIVVLTLLAGQAINFILHLAQGAIWPTELSTVDNSDILGAFVASAIACPIMLYALKGNQSLTMTAEQFNTLALLRASLDSTESAVAVIDKDMTTRIFNRKFLEMWGIDAPAQDAMLDFSLAFERFSKLCISEDFTRKLPDTVVTIKQESREVIALRDGRVLECLSAPQRDSTGQALLILSFRDITASWSAERERFRHASQVENSMAELRRLKLAIESISTGVTITDLAGTIIYTNPAEAAMHGYSADYLIGKDISIFNPTGRQHKRDFQKEHFASEFTRESQNIRHDGVAFPVMLKSVAIKDTAGQPIGLITISEDISERKRFEEDLHTYTYKLEQYSAGLMLAEEKFRALFHQAADAIFLVTSQEDKGLTITECNNAASQLYGYSQQELTGLPLAAIIDPASHHNLPPSIVDFPVGKRLFLEGDHMRRDATAFPVEVSAQVVEIHEHERFMIWIVRDVTDRKRLEQQLIHHSLYDTLTNVPNRALLMDRLSTLFLQRQRDPERIFAAIFIDLDHFKKVNDSLGHIAGDALLVEVSRRIQQVIRPGDTVARLGGDEFVVVLDALNAESDATDTALRINASLSEPFLINGAEVYSGASIGVAIARPEHCHPDDLLGDADIAMYQAKCMGRSQTVVFDKEMRLSMVDALSMENDLRGACERGEFSLVYQPIIDIVAHETVGFEALIRWHHPLRGLLGPDLFIPVLEDTGMIMVVGRWALQNACAFVHALNSESPKREFYISVNVSPKQFTEDLPVVVREVLADTGLRPDRLRLEITEGILIGNSTIASSVIDNLRELGVQVYLDDFGTGYSSLSYLHRYPVDAIKIDRSFVRNIMDDKDAQEIVSAISTLGRKLNKRIIVEGVETSEQLALFQTLLCTHVQGFLFSRPLATDKINGFLDGFGGK